MLLDYIIEKMFYCCVPLCKSTSKAVSMHRFPLDEKLCTAWVKQIGNERLYNKSMDDLRKSYRVCDFHFDHNCRIDNGKGRRGCSIKADAIPSLYLPCHENKENVEDKSHEKSKHSPKPSTSAGDEAQSVVETSTLSRVQVDPSDIKIQESRPSLRGGKILKSIGVRKLKDMPPIARSLYKLTATLREKSRRLQSQLTSTKDRLKQAQQFLHSPEYLRAKLNQQTYKFIVSQLKLQKVPAKGRRFSLEDKIFALALLKQSPRGYTLLRKIFALPSRRTLSNLLRKIHFEPGINCALFSILNTRCQAMEELDKYCTIIFDEMTVEPGLYYNEAQDIIEGFQDNGNGERKAVFADKAMVFMARGIRQKWKQVLAYFFNEGGMKSDVLVKTLKEVIRNVRSAGLKVLCVVCDQGTANRSAINYLYEETRQKYNQKGIEKNNFGFEIDDEEVIPIYDVPHLLKCIRTILFKYKVTYTWREGENRTAQWKHIRNVYELEDPEWDYKLCHKLTDAHIENTKKMKVSVAAQVMSARVAATMKMLARLDGIEQEAVDTAEFLIFIDRTFDSLNGSRLKPKAGKLLRTAVTKNSQHQLFWKEAVQVFESMSCTTVKKSNFKPPTIQNWIHTLKAFDYLWQKLQSLGFTFMCPRNFNQDPIENFFGSIRSHGVRNINPDCRSFKNSLKSLTINNYFSVHSYSSNCEADNLNSLSTLKEFLSCADSNPQLQEPVDIEIFNISFKSRTCKSSLLSYLAGYIAKKLLKIIRSCNVCRRELISIERDLSNTESSLIKARAYSSKCLLYPNTNFNTFFHDSINIFTHLMPNVCAKDKVKFNIETNFLAYSDYAKIFTCTKHYLVNLFFNITCRFHIQTWCKNINRILKGKDSRKYEDPIKILAYEKYKKHKGAKAKGRLLKNLQ